MKKKIVMAISLTVVAVFLAANSLYAEHCPEGKGEKFEKLTKELGLTPEQKTQLDAQREAFKAKNEGAWKKLKAKKEELRNELEKPSVDRGKINATIEDIKSLTGEKLNNRVDKILAMKSVLTPEQFAKLQNKMREKYKKREGKKREMKHHTEYE